MQQSSQWKSLSCYEWKQHAKCIVEQNWCWLFSSIKKVLYNHGYDPQGQTITQNFCIHSWDISMMQCITNSWKSKHHHDSTSCAAMFYLRQYSTSEKASLLTRYGSLWLSLPPELKENFKGGRFNDVKTTKHNVMEQLLVIPKSWIKRCFQNWKGQLNKHVVLKMSTMKQITVPLSSQIHNKYLHARPHITSM